MLPYLTKSPDLSDLPLDPAQIPCSRPALKLRARLRWDRKHVEPELGNLFIYYRNSCSLSDGRKTCSELVAKYDEIGRRLAKMWSIDCEIPGRKFNHYSYAANRNLEVI